jgi:hypothetical protein
MNRRHKKINPDDWKVRCGYSWMLVNWNGLFFLLFLGTRTPIQVAVDSSSLTIEESLPKWQSPWRIVDMNRTAILPLQDDRICPAVVMIWADSWIFCLIIRGSLSLFNSSTAPFGRPSASLEIFHSLILPHYAYRFSLWSAQNTTEAGVLFKCWCSLTLTLTTSIGIWHSAGATTSWSSVVSLSYT